MNDVNLPDKVYFRIGEVCGIVGIKPHVLRYWESEFPQIRPSKTSGGLRLYKQNDIQTISRIKYLLYEKGHTIAGARKALADMRTKDTGSDKSEIVEKVLEELRALKNILK